MSVHLAILALALLIDRLVGDPPWLWQRWRHPVAWIGGAIAAMDRSLNRPRLSFRLRRAAGVVVAVVLVLGGLFFGAVVDWIAGLFGLLGAVAVSLVVAVFLAHKSLVDHVRAVDDALRDKGLEAGRRKVAMIVGRDPETLDEAAVRRAAIESLAENASDGVVAPLFWFLLLGLPGLFAYKAINTADSMIGHMNERHRAFGWASAKLDDGLSFVPARLTAFLLALASDLKNALGPADGAPSLTTILAVTRRDAPSHRSPNAGWPETAMAAALDLRLGGPRRYGEIEVEAPFLNPAGRAAPGPGDIRAAIVLFGRAMTMVLALLVLAAVIASL